MEGALVGETFSGRGRAAGLRLAQLFPQSGGSWMPPGLRSGAPKRPAGLQRVSRYGLSGHCTQTLGAPSRVWQSRRVSLAPLCLYLDAALGCAGRLDGMPVRVARSATGNMLQSPDRCACAHQAGVPLLHML